jgi:hypothetical protein
MSPGLSFASLFRGVLARQVEYSYSDAADSYTTMVPLHGENLPQVRDLAAQLPFAGDWSWATERFARAVQPNAYLLRLDWREHCATAVTLYCRFPGEPGAATFEAAMAHARPFVWNGPPPAGLATALGVGGPRGIAFRAGEDGRLHTALYFKSEAHAGAPWRERLPALLAVCGYPDGLASTLERDLKDLYQPGPAGVVGVNDGADGLPRAVKFDPANVPLGIALAFLAHAGASAQRIAALRTIALGLRADAASYVGVQYGPNGLLGWRLYFACEPVCAPTPGRPALDTQRNLRPLRRLPHY